MARATTALRRARNSAAAERHGRVVLHVLARIAGDPVLLGALRGAKVGAARAEANRIIFQHVLAGGGFINHVVRIRFTQASSVLIDANASNLAVAGPSVALRRVDGARLGILSVSIQDLRGYLKYVHDNYGFDLAARSQYGPVLSTLPAVAHRTLPPSGCTTVGGTRYAVRSFSERSFVGGSLTIWTLTA